MRREEKPVTWEVKDPKIPPVRMENRVERKENNTPHRQ